MAEQGLGRLPGAILEPAPSQNTMGDQSQGQPRMIGDYAVTQQIGSGSFAVVWKGRHKDSKREVAIKEIATEKLNKKLRESLESEIAILEKANHPNIIHLIEIVKHPDRIFLILEYCAGGDLSEYIRKNGRVPESIARHFLRQLGAGLQVLRSNNLIHRDLKPQNLLLLTKDKNAVLKIADFGFARSLQPQNLAETLCGSPLYMAPEILQFQKYDAKADLWSVGAILFELVTGRPPFGGANHVQLLRNIESSDARIPVGVASSLSDACVSMIRLLLRRNPVERLSFEEFFHHPFLDLPKRRSAPDAEAPTPQPSPPESQPNPSRLKPSGQRQSMGGANIASMKPPPPLSSSPFHQEGASRGRSISSGGADYALKHGSKDWDTKGPLRGGKGGSGPGGGGSHQPPSRGGSSQRPPSADSLQKGKSSVDSMEGIEREYVVIHVPLQVSSEMGQDVGGEREAVVGGQLSAQPPGGESARPESAEAASVGSRERSQDSREEAPQAPSPPARIASLHRCARLITELAIDKFDAELRLEALSLHLLCLAAWREAITVCHAWAETLDGDETDVSAPPFSDASLPGSLSSQRMLFDAGPEAACASVEREFLLAVERAEGVAQELGAERDAEVPDAMELVFQAALAVGRAGAVEELMNNASNAAVAYKKAAALFHFLLVEAPSLHTTSREPLVLAPSDSHRLRRYHDALTARLAHCTEQRALQHQQKQQQKAGFGLQA